MAWSANVATLILDDTLDVTRTYLLEMRNGFFAATGLPWEEVIVRSNGWSVEIQDGNPVVGHARFTIPIEDFTYMDEFDKTNAVMMFTEARFSCTITTIAGDETEYLFRGSIRTIDKVDTNIIVDVVGPLEKLKTSLTPLAMEALRDPASGFHTDVGLRHDDSDIFDAPGDVLTFEIDPNVNCPGPLCQDWAEDIFGSNRAWVPHGFVVQQWLDPDWVEIVPSEYLIDTSLGLVFFSEDQAGNVFRLKEVIVYVEGTLEIADIVQAMLSIPNVCPIDPDDKILGCGFTDAQLSSPLSGVLTFDGADPYLVTGVGCSFDTELEVGDRFYLDVALTPIVIVREVLGANSLEIRYPYDLIGGVMGTAGAGIKSSLKTSGVNISNINWSKCDGTAATLFRQLQKNYSDSKGYKIHYNHMDDQVVGWQVRAMNPDIPAEASKIIEMPQVKVGGLKVQSTTEDFGSAVASSGTIGRAKNLITQPGITITDLAILLPPDPGASLWFINGVVGPGTFGNLSWTATTAGLNDRKIQTAYGVSHIYPDWTTWHIYRAMYFDFLEIDLLDIFEISEVIVYGANRRRLQEPMGIDIYGSVDGVTWIPVSIEAIHYELEPDEVKSFITEGVTARYLKIKMRPDHWIFGSRPELTMALREIIIYGVQKMCTVACIQDQIAHGIRNAGAGTITFTAGGPPWIVDGVGTSFGVAGHPGVGDYIALATDQSHYGFIAAVINPLQVHLWYEYGGVPGAGNPYEWTDGSPPYIEGLGGHFIGTSSTIDDNFKRDYYPHLFNKMSVYGHRTILDDTDLVTTPAQLLDRAYIILDEIIRLYRAISSTHPFDVRPVMFDTLVVNDDYRVGGSEDLTFLVQGIKMSDTQATYAGTEFGAGVLE